MNNVVAIKQEEEAERIEFGGVVWVKDKDGRFRTYIEGQGSACISQYTEDDHCKGRWHWLAHIDVALNDLNLAVTNKHLSDIEDTRDDAMSACINALDDYLADLRSILLKLSPSDDYANGFADGKAVLAAKLSAEIDAAMAAA